jgi:hypothetical protein
MSLFSKQYKTEHVWKPSNTGGLSSKSAYNAFFGSTRFAPWKSWDPLAIALRFFLWVAVFNHWHATVDWLAKHGLPHLAACPLSLCDQAPETVNHLLLSLHTHCTNPRVTVQQVCLTGLGSFLVPRRLGSPWLQLQTGGALEDLLASVQLSANSDVRTSSFETEGHGLDGGQVSHPKIILNFGLCMENTK